MFLTENIPETDMPARATNAFVRTGKIETSRDIYLAGTRTKQTSCSLRIARENPFGDGKAGKGTIKILREEFA